MLYPRTAPPLADVGCAMEGAKCSSSRTVPPLGDVGCTAEGGEVLYPRTAPRLADVECAMEGGEVFELAHSPAAARLLHERTPLINALGVFGRSLLHMVGRGGQMVPWGVRICAKNEKTRNKKEPDGPAPIEAME